MFKHKLIKHIYNTDVAFQVTHEVVLTDRAKLKGYWVNIIVKNRYVIDKDKITIAKKDYKNWKQI